MIEQYRTAGQYRTAEQSVVVEQNSYPKEDGNHVVFLPTGLKTISWILEELLTSSFESQHSLTLLKLAVRF